jgi:NADH-quinone oxidoreductase subunit L
MPVTFWTFLIGTLALSGLWPFSGFFSKDAILGAAYQHSMTLFAVGILVAFLTTFYMFRLVFVVFLGKAKSDAVHHAHESPPVMTGPLIVLAIASVAGGFLGISRFLQPQFSPMETEVPVFAPFEPFQQAPVAAILGLAAFGIGLAAAAVLYGNAESDPLPARFTLLCRLTRNKFYFDELYAELIALTQDAVAQFAEGVDFLLKLLVRAVHGSTELAGRGLRLAQTGSLQTYAFFFAAGIAVVLYLMLLH